MSEASDPSALPAREQAAEQAHPLRKIFDHANDAILLIDPEHDRICHHALSGTVSAAPTFHHPSRA